MPLEHPVLGFGPAGLWGRREDVGIWSRGIFLPPPAPLLQKALSEVLPPNRQKVL